MLLAGYWVGKKATTKREVLPQEPSPLELMRQRYPRIDVDAASLVDCDGITTGGGVSLCIDATLYIIERELGVRVARETAQIIRICTSPGDQPSRVSLDRDHVNVGRSFATSGAVSR